MKHFNRLAILVASAAFFIATAQAQNSGTVANHAVPIGKGPGISGFSSAAPGAAGRPLISNGPSADPGFSTLGSVGGGTGADNSTNAVNDVLASNGSNGTFVKTALLTLINTVCTAAPTTCAKLFGFYSPMWFGAVCDNSTNDATALQSAVTAAGGKWLFVPAGYYCVTNAVLTIGADNTMVSGAGRDVSGFKSTISNRGAIFYMANRQGITISDLALVGTRSMATWSLPSFGAIDVEQDNAAAAVKSGFVFKSLKLSGFNSTYWIQISLGNSAFDMTNVVLDDILFTTVAADIPTDATASNNVNYAIAIYGGSTGPAVKQSSVRNITIEGTGVCFGIGLYQTHSNFSVTDNKLINVGGTSTVAHCTNGLGFTNSYPIFVYDINGAGFPSTGGLISRNYILNPYSNGIYVVGAQNATLAYNDFDSVISENVIIGQSQTDLAIRGAIALNNYTNTLITGNRLYNNWAGIVTSGQYIGQVTVSNNDCVTNVSGGTCWALAGATGTTGNVPVHLVKNNNFNTTGSSSATTKITSDASHYLGSVYFSGNSVVASVTGATFSGLFANGSLTINNNNFSGAGTLLTVSGLTGPTLTLLGNTGVSFTAATLPTATNGSSVFVSDGTPATACTAAGTGSTAFRQNSAWKCF